MATTHKVVHPKLYMAVNDKLQHVEKDSELTLTPKQAEKLGTKVVKLGKK